MKKEMYQKKIIVFLFIAMFLTPIIASIVIAQQNPSDSPYDDSIFEGDASDLSLWERWKAGLLNGIDTKIILFIMVSIIAIIIFSSLGLKGYSFFIGIPLAFLLTAFATPDAILGIMKTYDTLPLVIATSLPMILLFAFTYLAASKENGTLAVTQYLAWFLYFFVSLAKAIFVWVSWIYGPELKDSIWSFLEYMITIPQNPEQYYWFTFAIIASLIISFIMVFANKTLFKKASDMIHSVKNVVAEKTMDDAAEGIKNAAKFEHKLEGGAGI